MENPVSIAPDRSVICALVELRGGHLETVDAAQDEGQTSYVIYRNASQLKCLCCGAVRFRLRSACRRLPLFVCDHCGQMLEEH